jgi:hypothetical protein
MIAAVPSSREELLQYVAQLSGREIRTRAELEVYLNELEARNKSAQPGALERRWTIAKQAVLGAGLVMAALQYYLIHVYVEIASMPRVQFFNPLDAALHRSGVELLRLFC